MQVLVCCRFTDCPPGAMESNIGARRWLLSSDVVCLGGSWSVAVPLPGRILSGRSPAVGCGVFLALWCSGPVPRLVSWVCAQTAPSVMLMIPAHAVGVSLHPSVTVAVVFCWQ